MNTLNIEDQSGFAVRTIPQKVEPRATFARTSSIHFSSKSNEWGTPQWLFENLDREFGFNLDPCSTHENAKCKRHFTLAEDGLSRDWSAKTVFMNPPYGREIGLWMKKAFMSAKDGATVVCLVPARTDTAWWHNFAIQGEIRFLKGRLKFGDATSSAPFPSAIVVFRPLGVKGNQSAGRGSLGK